MMSAPDELDAREHLTWLGRRVVDGEMDVIADGPDDEDTADTIAPPTMPSGSAA